MLEPYNNPFWDKSGKPRQLGPISYHTGWTHSITSLAGLKTLGNAGIVLSTFIELIKI